MEAVTLIGLLLLGCALTVLVGMVIYSRGVIERIARDDLGSLRDYMRKRQDER